MNRRITAALLATVLMLAMLPMGALAAEEIVPVEPLHETCLNPLYGQLLDESVLETAGAAMALAEEEEYFSDAGEAGAALREQMEQRQQTVSLNIVMNSLDKQMMHDVFNAALVHTGDPTEGDYLLWQYAGWDCEASGYRIGSTYYMTFNYVITYYSTAQQEQQVDEEVARLLEQLDLVGLDDYEKIRAVYDWICANVAYDNEHVEDSTYLTQYTAYGALIDRTAVCQGYSVLLYRLLLELGIDVRVISGYGNGPHGWNIVQLEGKYYNADATWDAGETVYRYFLQNQMGFADHTRDYEYRTEAFHAAYPMAGEDYPLPAVVAGGPCGEDMTWELNDRGLLTISGSGVMTNAPWKGEAGIRRVIIGSDVQSIADGAFANTEVSEVTFRGNAPAIGADAFANVTAVVNFPADCDGWIPSAMGQYGGSLTWEPYRVTSPFTDVAQADYFCLPVIWAVRNGVTAGYGSDTVFNPDGNCTRGQVVTFLWRAAGEPEPSITENPFGDVTEKDYFYKPVLWALENGITTGLTAENFGPNEACTRGQVVTFLWRAEGQPQPASTENPFGDVAEKDYFFNPVLWAIESGITNGYGGNDTFYPEGICTRGQVVTFLYRGL